MLAGLMDAAKNGVAAFLIVCACSVESKKWEGQIAHFCPTLRTYEYQGSRGERREELAKLKSGNMWCEHCLIRLM
jgi:hypothetical protein